MAAARGADDVAIRECRPTDDDAISRLNDAAFGGRYESRLIDDLRAAGLVAVELVAVELATIEQAAIVGHFMFSELGVTIDREPIRALALAPMAVRPDQQRRGVGSALMRAGLDWARKCGWQAVVVLGHPAYYARFGFSAELTRPFSAPFRGDAFMALELTPCALKGKDRQIVYPPAFSVEGG